MKQELAVKTGMTLSQIECGAYSVNSNKPQGSNYFAKDDHLVTAECKILRNGWIFDLQRVDGTKVVVHAPGVCEVCLERSTAKFVKIYSNTLLYCMSHTEHPHY